MQHKTKSGGFFCLFVFLSLKNILINIFYHSQNHNMYPVGVCVTGCRFQSIYLDVSLSSIVATESRGTDFIGKQ